MKGDSLCLHANNPRMITPMKNLSQTTVTGDTSLTAIFVAMKDAPQITIVVISFYISSVNCSFVFGHYEYT